MFIIIKNANDVKITFVKTNGKDLSVYLHTIGVEMDNTCIIFILWFSTRNLSYKQLLSKRVFFFVNGSTQYIQI